MSTSEDLNTDPLKQRLRAALRERQQLQERARSRLDRLMKHAQPLTHPEDLQSYEPGDAQSNQHSSVTEWLVHKLPEEWRGHLDDLKQVWSQEGMSEFNIKWRTQLYLLQVGVAAIRIYGIGLHFYRRH